MERSGRLQVFPESFEEGGPVLLGGPWLVINTVTLQDLII